MTERKPGGLGEPREPREASPSQIATAQAEFFLHTHAALKTVAEGYLVEKHPHWGNLEKKVKLGYIRKMTQGLSDYYFFNKYLREEVSREDLAERQFSQAEQVVYTDLLTPATVESLDTEETRLLENAASYTRNDQKRIKRKTLFAIREASEWGREDLSEKLGFSRQENIGGKLGVALAGSAATLAVTVPVEIGAGIVGKLVSSEQFGDIRDVKTAIIAGLSVVAEVALSLNKGRVEDKSLQDPTVNTCLNIWATGLHFLSQKIDPLSERSGAYSGNIIPTLIGTAIAASTLAIPGSGGAVFILREAASISMILGLTWYTSSEYGRNQMRMGSGNFIRRRKPDNK